MGLGRGQGALYPIVEIRYLASRPPLVLDVARTTTATGTPGRKEIGRLPLFESRAGRGTSFFLLPPAKIKGWATRRVYSGLPKRYRIQIPVPEMQSRQFPGAIIFPGQPADAFLQKVVVPNPSALFG